VEGHDRRWQDREQRVCRTGEPLGGHDAKAQNQSKWGQRLIDKYIRAALDRVAEDMQKIVDANEKLVRELKDYAIHGK